MENASKALIIAGAILLAILLISLGILIFNQAQDTVNNSGMTQAEITAFNNKFLKYRGDNQPGSVVKALINDIIASNADPMNANRQITITLNNVLKTDFSNITSEIINSKKYIIRLSYGNGANGVITAVFLTQK